MKRITQILLSLMAVVSLDAAEPPLPNPLIDYTVFARDVPKVAELRQQRRICVEDFVSMAKEPETLILDTRTKANYEAVHVKGAVHLNISDFSEEKLAKVVPSKNTRVLIYCNNNFLGDNSYLKTKSISAALNIYTFNSLYAYGYKNVYELAPVIDLRKSDGGLELERAKPAGSPGKE